MCRSAMTPAHMPRSRRRSKLTEFVRPRRRFQGPINTAAAVRKSAGYAVAMLSREITSRRMENNSQNSATHAMSASTITTCRAILWRQYEEHRSRRAVGKGGFDRISGTLLCRFRHHIPVEWRKRAIALKARPERLMSDMAIFRQLTIAFELPPSRRLDQSGPSACPLFDVALTAGVSATDSIPQTDHAVAEPVLVKQFQLQPHSIREEPFPGADDRRADEHLKLVNKTSP